MFPHKLDCCGMGSWNGSGAALVVVPPIGGRANKDRHHFSSSSPRSLTQVCHQLKLTNVNYQNQKKKPFHNVVGHSESGREKQRDDGPDGDVWS